MHVKQPATRISLIAALSRKPALPADAPALERWLTASGWVYDARSPRWPWLDPQGVDSWTLRDAVRGQAQLVAARKLRRRGWIVGTVGPGALSPGWCEGPTSRRQVTLVHALRLEGVDGVWPKCLRDLSDLKPAVAVEQRP